MNSLFLCLLVVILAAVFQGSFAVPMSYTRNWKWEQSWLVFSVFGMIVFNIVFAAISLPHLFEVYRTAPFTELIVPLVSGLFFGISAISFGLGITAVGFFLGYSIMLGTNIAMGTFIPMALLHPEDILSVKGLLVLFGVIISLAGIAVSGYAGIIKEREQGRAAGRITRDSKFSTKVGIIICFINGLCASAINIGFSLSSPLVERALSYGASETWAGTVVWAILFSTGGIVNVLYCLYLMGVNKTANYARVKESPKNFLLLLLMSLIWIGSFILYGIGATKMGSWGTVIGWSVYMALAIMVAMLWGIFQGEWVGATRATKLLMAKGVVIIFCAIVIFAFSGTQ